MTVNIAKFSVIIPTYNRPHQLSKCLDSIAKQNYSKQRFEVIVINDGGAELKETIDPFQSELSIILLVQENAGPASARNKGSMVARGDFLVFTDDDCYCPPNWLKQLEEHCDVKVEPTEISVIDADLKSVIEPEQVPVMFGGHTVNSISSNLFSVASQMIVALAYQYFNPCSTRASFFASNNMVFPRVNFLELGGFHPEFRASEDREICDRWLRSGYRMEYVSDVEIHHAHHLSLLTFCRQHFSYGRGAYLYHRIRRQRGEPPFRPDFSFHIQLLTYPFKTLPWFQALIVMVLMILSQFASLLGYHQEKISCARSAKDS